MNFRIIISILVFINLVACQPKTEMNSVSEVDNYDKLEFEKQLSYILTNRAVLNDSTNLKNLYDSVASFDSCYFRINESPNDNEDYSFESIYFLFGEIPCIKSRNLFEISLYKTDSIYLDRSLLTKEIHLSDSMFTFINSKVDDYDHPEMKQTKINGLGDTLVSKHLFIINTNLIDSFIQKRTKWTDLYSILDSVIYSYNLVRENASQQLFNKPSVRLTKKEIEILKKLHPIRIQIFPDVDRLEPIPTPPPPPPPSDSLFWDN